LSPTSGRPSAHPKDVHCNAAKVASVVVAQWKDADNAREISSPLNADENSPEEFTRDSAKHQRSGVWTSERVRDKPVAGSKTNTSMVESSA